MNSQHLLPALNKSLSALQDGCEIFLGSCIRKEIEALHSQAIFLLRTTPPLRVTAFEDITMSQMIC